MMTMMTECKELGKCKEILKYTPLPLPSSEQERRSILERQVINESLSTKETFQNYGAAIVPFAVDNKHGNPFILLARSAFPNRNNNKAIFTTFGGMADLLSQKRCGQRETAEMTAAREFYEETLFCAEIEGIDGPLAQRPVQFAEKLRKGG